MGTFYSPDGNPEVWAEKPDGYLTVEEWLKANPPEAPEVIEIEAPVAPPLEDRISALEDVVLSIILGEA